MLWQRHTLRHLALGQGVTNIVINGIGWTTVFFVRNHHMGTAEVGLWTAIGYVANALGIWLSGHLAGQVALLERHPEVGLVYGPTEEWYGWTGRLEDSARDHVSPLRIPTGQPLFPPGPIAAFVRREAPSPCTCSVLARRSVVDATGGFEASFRGMYDDQVFYAKACLAAPVLAAAECSSRYRRRPDSLYSWAKTTDQHRFDRLKFLRWLDRYLMEQGGGSAELVRAVRRELWTARHPRLWRLLGGLRGWR